MNNLTSTSRQVLDDNPFTKPEIAALWIKCVEKVSGEFREQHIYPRLRAWEGEQMDGQILEVGSGQGVCCQCLATERRYLGVEPSEPLHLRAVEQYQKGERSFILGNAYSLPVSDGSCAGAFSVNVWMHLSDLGKAARELSRVLGFSSLPQTRADMTNGSLCTSIRSETVKRLSAAFIFRMVSTCLSMFCSHTNWKTLRSPSWELVST